MISMKNDRIFASWNKIEPSESANERMLSAILERNRSIHKGKDKVNYMSKTKKPVWVRWVAVAACLCLAVGIAVPRLIDVFQNKGGIPSQTYDGPDSLVQEIAALEFNGAYYEATDIPEALERYGLPTVITENMAGKHLSYLEPNGGAGYKESATETDIELLEYAPASCRGVYVIRDGSKYLAALFCNILSLDDNASTGMETLYGFYGIESPDDIVSITEVSFPSRLRCLPSVWVLQRRHCLPVWVVAFTRKPPTSVLILWVRLRLIFLRTIRAILPPLPIMWVIMWAMLLSTAALGATAFAMVPEMQLKAVIAPMLIAAVGVFLSIFGIYLVRTKEGATMKDLLHSLSLGTNIAALLIAAATFGILYLLQIENWLGLSFSVITGLAAGVIIGQATEYYTSHSYKPTQKISEAGLTGSATVIIKGIGTGMISTCIPVVTIGVAIMLSYLCANGFNSTMSAEALSQGLYGIGIAAVGMLSTLGITLATDAYGPIADNAGGNAEMSELGEEVRHRTDALDALGNTTAATGKGFAIGSAALTALALLASYIEEVKIAMERAGMTLTNLKGEAINAAQATIPDFMNYFQVNLMNPRVLVGAFIGAMAAFLFCGLTMEAVGRAAQKMVEEVRRQFREIAGILEGKATPDYGRCVEISTIPLVAGHCHSHCCGNDPWCGWRLRLVGRRFGRRFHAGSLYGECRWCLGQCQEDGGRRQLWRKGFVCP